MFNLVSRKKIGLGKKKIELRFFCLKKFGVGEIFFFKMRNFRKKFSRFIQRSEVGQTDG